MVMKGKKKIFFLLINSFYSLKFLQCAKNTVTFLPLIVTVETCVTFAGIKLLLSSTNTSASIETSSVYLK